MLVVVLFLFGLVLFLFFPRESRYNGLAFVCIVRIPWLKHHGRHKIGPSTVSLADFTLCWR